MNKQSLRQDSAAQKASRGFSPASVCARLGLAAALCGALAASMSDSPSAQQRGKEPSVRVTGVTTAGNTVSISADGSLNRAQTWQDPEGFHVVVVNGEAAGVASARGVKTRRVGNSLELVVPVRQGASVTVEPRGQRLDLVVSGGTNGALNVENFPTDARAENSQSARRDESRARQERRERQAQSDAEQRASQPASKRRAAPDATAPDSQPSAAQNTQQPAPQSTSKPSPATTSSAQAAAQAPSQSQAVEVANNGSQAQPAAVENSESVAAAQLNSAQPNPEQSGSDGGILSSLLSLPGLLIAVGVALACAAFFLVRRSRGRSGEEFETRSFEKAVTASADESKSAALSAGQPFRHTVGDRRKTSVAVPFERRRSGRGAEDEASRQQLADVAGRNGHSQDGVPDVKVAASPSAGAQFGAYRIDQEISRLVQGKPHSVEALSSRALDDRRAVETSLLKALRAPETDEDGRRRARTALEDYGFVARSCAQLLLGPESFERASAARSLGEMKSAHALPFLTEALYDADPVVRLECVQSLGALGQPSAIGALLDVSRRHPEISANVLGPALTACSVESVEANFDSLFGGRAATDAGESDWYVGDVSVLAPVAVFEELPEWVEDETLRAALDLTRSAEVETRVRAAQQLAQFHVRRAVEALAAMSQEDPQPAVRSAAVTSLGLVDHESVFAPVIISLADEAREVRASSARALSRLSFDRADAYVRVIESADERTLRSVARAAVKAGLTAQAIQRLASEDRGQAYEAYSLLSLCVKAGEWQPVLDTIECHRDIEVRLACINLLAHYNTPEVFERLARIGDNGGVPEKVRRAILEMVEQAPEPQPVAVR